MFKRKNILVLGYFGYNTNQLDGQTIKTREIKNLFNKYTGDDGYKYFDTQLLQNGKGHYIKLFTLLFWCDHLIYLPGKNNLSRLSRLLQLFINLKKTKVYYIVVGGWLSDFLSVNQKLSSLLHDFEFIGVESNALADDLSKKFQLRNVEFFPNFRIHNYVPDIAITEEPLKLVFMARVMREKGIDTLFELAKAVEDRELNVTITFYGPIAKEDEAFFNHGVNSSKLINYNGSLNPSDIHNTLSNYDVLVLPTRYEGEGFPGSVLDSYISGIPVIVSNWKFIPEFVKENKTGFVINDIDGLIDKVVYLKSNNKVLLDMKKNAYEESKLYSSEAAWKKINSIIFTNSRT